jgi:hypothetical protein
MCTAKPRGATRSVGAFGHDDNVEGIAWLSRDTLVAVSDRKKRRQPARCAEKDQSIHLFRNPAG